jgi:hypothetical protein
VKRYGHHPDREIDLEVEIGRLEGLLAEAHAGLLRALDYRSSTTCGTRFGALSTRGRWERHEEAA